MIGAARRFTSACSAIVASGGWRGLLRLGSGVAALIVTYHLELGKDWMPYSVWWQGVPFSAAFQGALWHLTAFLIGWLLAKALADQRRVPVWLSLVQAAFSALMGVMFSACFAAFPAFALVCCRLVCPCSLYDPKALERTGDYGWRVEAMRRESSRAVSLEDAAAFLAMTILTGMLLLECAVAVGGGGIVILAILAFAVFHGLIFKLKGQKNRPSTSRKTACFLFRYMQVMAWVFLCAIVLVRYAFVA